MALNQEHNRSYSKLAQIYNFFLEKIPDKPALQNILTKEGDINFKIPPNSCIPSTGWKLIGCTALHIAAMNNDIEFFDTLVSEGADFIVQDNEGRTALHWLFDQLNFNPGFDIKMLSMHLSLEDPTNPCDKNGLSHFHIACQYNQTDIVQFFLTHGIPVDLPVNSNAEEFAGYTPLHFAVKNMSFQVMNVLLKHKANMNAKEGRGLTPLHLLLEEKIKTVDSYRRENEMIPNQMIELMDEAMNLLLDINNVDDIGLTAFHVACTQRDISMVESFLDQDVDISQQVNMDSPIYPGYTALHFAVHCNLKIVNMLLKKKADCMMKDVNGATPVQLMLERFTRDEIRMIIKENWNLLTFSDNSFRMLEFYDAMDNPTLMREYLGNVNDNSSTVLEVGRGMSGWSGYTLLHFAVMLCKDRDIIEVFMSRGFNFLIDVQDSSGSTPIHLAFRMNKFEIVLFLMIHTEGRTNITANDGLSYLHIACAISNPICVQMFSRDSNIDLPYFGTSTYSLVTPGSTALHVGMASENSAIIDFLVHRKLNFEALDAKGLTPFHRFLRFKYNAEVVCQSLLKSGALSDDMLGKYGLTRLHLAIYCAESDILQFISDTNIDVVVKCRDSLLFFYPYDDCTPLLMGMKRNLKIEVIRSFLERDADFLKKNEKGETPLYEALTSSSNYNSLEEIMKILKISEALTLKMEEMSGITKLHIACHMVNQDYVAILLASRLVDVNAKVKPDCKIWPGCTPLHVIMKNIERNGVNERNCEIVSMLLLAGADVAALDESGETPIHLSMRNSIIEFDDKLICQLLTNLRVFNINPFDKYGMSHFHAACLVNIVDVVKSFLENGVDVNQPVDFFAINFAGETPLCLAVDHRIETVFVPEHKKETVLVLLESGADVKAENHLGSTTVHKAVKLTDHLDILELLVGHGASLDIRNIYGQTPLELLLQSENVSAEKIKFFEKCGCRLNDTNSLTEEGYISMLISKHYQPDSKHKLEIVTKCLQIMIDAVDSMIPDSMGRNLLHNIVATVSNFSEKFSYNDLIKRFQTAGVDIDLQDKKGRTALHLAAQFGNLPAFRDLLNNGADSNILDAMDRPALQYAIEYHSEEKDCVKKNYQEQIIEHIVPYITMLQQLGLEVNSYNNLQKRRAFKVLNRMIIHRYNIPNLIDTARKLIIDNQAKLTVKDFLSEMGRGLMDYPFMSEENRDRVDRFFRDYDANFKDVYALQYRKAVKRGTLVKLLIEYLQKIGCAAMPIVCFEMIVQYLKNSELENFSKATALVD